jgi:hypothetical protein
VSRLGANALGEVLAPGRVPDCYLGPLLDQPGGDAEVAGVLVVAPASLLHPAVPQPDGTVLYELVTGHPDRAPGELVFLADLTWSCVPGPMAPGLGTAWTRRQSSAAGGTATFRASSTGG